MARAATYSDAIGAGAEADPGEAVKLSWIAKVTMVSLVIPFQFFVGSITLNPSRVVFLVLVPILTIQLLTGRFGKLIVTDFLIFFFCFWQILAISIHNPDAALSFAGIQSLTLLGGYLAGRASIRSVADFQALARFFALLLIILLPFAALEAITGKRLIMDTINDFAGYRAAKFNVSGERLGLDRANVVMGHAIHWGLYASMALSLYFVGLTNQEGFTKRFVIMSAILAAVFFSVSSGPFLAAVFQIALIVYMAMFHRIAAPWQLLLITGTVTYVLLDLVTSRPAIFEIASRLAFNSHTAAIRRQLWEVGTDQIAKAPFLGVGYTEWDHPSWWSGSIDNYWLALGIILGLPAMLAMLAAFLTIMIRAGRGTLIRGSDAYYARVAVTFVLISLFLSISTVAIWGEVLSMVFFILGVSGFLMQETIVDDPGARLPGQTPAAAPAGSASRRSSGRPDRTGASGKPRYNRSTTPEDAPPGVEDTPATTGDEDRDAAASRSARARRYTRFPPPSGQG